jgi:hypothetical protein
VLLSTTTTLNSAIHHPVCRASWVGLRAPTTRPPAVITYKSRAMEGQVVNRLNWVEIGSKWPVSYLRLPSFSVISDFQAGEKLREPFFHRN